MGRKKGIKLSAEKKEEFIRKNRETRERNKRKREQELADGIIDGEELDPESHLPNFPLCQFEMESGYKCLNVIKDGCSKDRCPEHRNPLPENGTYRESHFEEQFRSDVRKLIMQGSKKIAPVLVFQFTLDALKIIMFDQEVT